MNAVGTMRTRMGITTSAMLVLLASTAGAQGAKPLTRCAPDAVVSGTVCMDKYEASVWRVPNPMTTNRGLVLKIQQGKATAAMLAAGGATQLGSTYPAACHSAFEGSRLRAFLHAAWAWNQVAYADGSTPGRLTA